MHSGCFRLTDCSGSIEKETPQCKPPRGSPRSSGAVVQTWTKTKKPIIISSPGILAWIKGTERQPHHNTCSLFRRYRSTTSPQTLSAGSDIAGFDSLGRAPGNMSHTIHSEPPPVRSRQSAGACLYEQRAGPMKLEKLASSLSVSDCRLVGSASGGDHYKLALQSLLAQSK